MRKSLILVLVAVLGSVLAHFIMQDRGYVLVNFRGTAFETSVPGMLLVLALAYLLIRLVVRLLRAPRKFGQAVSGQRQNRARRKLNRGLIEMAEGNWKQGETMLAQGAKSGDMPLLNYLNAARAAQLQGEHERRDNWLMLAYEQDPDASTAVLLTQADLQISHAQYEEALATLQKVNDANPDHAHAHIMLAAIYEKLEDWENLAALTPKLRKIKKSPAAAEIDRLIRVAGQHQLSAAGIAGDKSQVKKIWQSFAASTRKQPAMVHAHAVALLDCGDTDAAETLVKKHLNSNWDPSLAKLYGKIEGSAPAKQLATAEGWLKNRGDDPVLLTTCASFAMRSKNPGKARSYLEASLGIEPRADTYQLYGELLMQLGETDNATAAFRQGLGMLTGGVSLTPALTGPLSNIDGSNNDGSDNDGSDQNGSDDDKDSAKKPD
ncbi:MAG: hypothetical protein HKN70_09700 [Gammaproteobacteria bacterium]|nr:hypothetical protein [Gammaproteobacteria bacterium]